MVLQSEQGLCIKAAESQKSKSVEVNIKKDVLEIIAYCGM